MYLLDLHIQIVTPGRAVFTIFATGTTIKNV